MRPSCIKCRVLFYALRTCYERGCNTLVQGLEEAVLVNVVAEQMVKWCSRRSHAPPQKGTGNDSHVPPLGSAYDWGTRTLWGAVLHIL